MAHPVAHPSHPRSVLIVDDSDTMRRMLRILLEEEGYAVEEAADGLDAFTRLSQRTTRYVVLLDYAMPRLDGWELLRLAAADSRLLTQHAYLVMTAEQTALPADCARFLADHAIPHLFKPIPRRTLLPRLAQAEAQLRRLGGAPAGTRPHEP